MRPILGMPLSEISLQVGKNESYFENLKTQSRKKYEWVLSFDSNPIASYRKALENARDMSDKIENIYRSYRYKQNMYNEIVSIGLFSHWQGARNGVENIIFSSRDGLPNWTVIKKMIVLSNHEWKTINDNRNTQTRHKEKIDKKVS